MLHKGFQVITSFCYRGMTILGGGTQNTPFVGLVNRVIFY